MVPKTVRFELPDRATVVLSDPVFIGQSVEDTPYQLMQRCDATQACTTLADLRGTGGLSISSNPTLAFSPDHAFVLCIRMIAIDRQARTYRSTAYEIYDLALGGPTSFRTERGKTASADNIRGWAPGEPHALEVSVSIRKTELARPFVAR